MNLKKTYPTAMIIVPLAVFMVFFILPSTIGYAYAFTNWNPFVTQIKFVGLENFKEIFNSSELGIASVNTISFALIKTVTVTVLGIVFALILNQRMKSRNVLRTIYFMPAVLSALVVGLIFAALFDANNGVINRMLVSMGLANLQQPWLGSRIPSLITINIAEIWRSVGYALVISLAGLQSVPAEYTEAATVDGASQWQTFKNITLPLIMPSVNVNILFSLIYGLKMFDLVYLLTRGGPGHDTETFGTLILNEMDAGRYAQSVTINLVFTIFLVIVAIVFHIYSKRTEADL